MTRANICVRIKPQEKEFCVDQAHREGLSLAGWIRSKCELDPQTSVRLGVTYSKKYLTFHLTVKEKKALQRDAKKYGFSLSDAIRVLCGIPVLD